jgi:hypothetical protein
MARSRRLAALGGAALVASGLVACNAIIGLNDFEKGQCAGARCDGGAEPDTYVPPEAGGPDAQVDGGKGADPVSWARWKMPNYDGGADAALLPLSYSGPTNGEITDLVTKLPWRDTFLPGEYSQSEAVAACAALGAWRLPKRIELVTLLDFARPDPFKINEKFGAPPLSPVWTSSEVRPFVGGDQQRYWAVNFGTGEVLDSLPGTTKIKVLCVKAKP